MKSLILTILLVLILSIPAHAYRDRDPGLDYIQQQRQLRQQRQMIHQQRQIQYQLEEMQREQRRQKTLDRFELSY